MAMGVHISDDQLSQAKMTPEEFLIEVATHLYDIGKLTLGQARNLANLDQISFQKELARRDIYIKYDYEDFLVDLRTIEELNKELDKS